MTKIELVRVSAGAVKFSADNVNATYKGPFLNGSGHQRFGIIKDLNKQQLVNELLAALIARDLGLPVPDAFLGFVDKSNTDIPAKQYPLVDGSGSYVFVSADVGVPDLAQTIKKPFGGMLESSIIEIIKQWAHLGKAYAFDTWIANIDRHKGNILFEFPSDIWLIDHGYSFTGPSWSIPDLKPLEKYANRLSEWLSASLTAHQKTTRSLEAKNCADGLKSVSYPAFVKSLSKVKLLSDSEARALTAFLDSRIPVVSRYANDAIGVLSLVK